MWVISGAFLAVSTILFAAVWSAHLSGEMMLNFGIFRRDNHPRAFAAFLALRVAVALFSVGQAGLYALRGAHLISN
jgi:hypothetical protein